MAMEIVVVRVKPNLKRRLSQIAERQEMTMAEVYRAAFEEYCSARHVEFIPAPGLPAEYQELLKALAGEGE